MGRDRGLPDHEDFHSSVQTHVNELREQQKNSKCYIGIAWRAGVDSLFPVENGCQLGVN